MFSWFNSLFNSLKDFCSWRRKCSNKINWYLFSGILNLFLVLLMFLMSNYCMLIFFVLICVNSIISVFLYEKIVCSCLRFFSGENLFSILLDTGKYSPKREEIFKLAPKRIVGISILIIINFVYPFFIDNFFYERSLNPIENIIQVYCFFKYIY